MMMKHAAMVAGLTLGLMLSFAHASTVADYTTAGYHSLVLGKGIYNITAEGASGGGGSRGGNPGFGAIVTGSFTLTSPETLRILVGGQGQANSGDAGGGGGASFVVGLGDSPLLIAGGGGGGGSYGAQGGNARGFLSGAGGGGGAGKGAPTFCCTGGGGGGSLSADGLKSGSFTFITPGGISTDPDGNVIGSQSSSYVVSGGGGGRAFTNGGTGGIGGSASGGFGGGGGSGSGGGGGGGGGGYYGGGGGDAFSGGSGGTSFDVGEDPAFSLAAAFGDGSVLVEDVSPSAVPLPASAPMFGAALLALGAIGYATKRKKSAAAA